MKILIVISLFALMTHNGFGQDFRNAEWGYSRKQVIAAEGEDFVDREDFIVYGVKVNQEEAWLHYYFKGDELYRAVYNFTREHENRFTYLKNFNEIASILKEKYGEPSMDESYWARDSIEYGYEDQLMAIALGELELFQTWGTERTLIVNNLRGNNNFILHSLEYSHFDSEMMTEMFMEYVEKMKKLEENKMKDF